MNAHEYPAERGDAVLVDAPAPAAKRPHGVLGEAHAAIRRGDPVVLAGPGPDEVRRSIMVIAAATASPAAISYMVRYTSGYVCVTLGPDDAARLRLPQLKHQWPGQATFDATVSVDAAAGVSTGISARDRARTIQLLGRADSEPDDLHRPGHVVPVVVYDHQVRGNTAAEDLPAAACLLVGGATSTGAAAYADLVSERNPQCGPTLAELREHCREHGVLLLSPSVVVGGHRRSRTPLALMRRIVREDRSSDKRRH